MIGVVVVAHFNLAREMVAATELIVGKQELFEYVDIFPDEDVEKIKAKVVEAVKKADMGDGLIILTDMFGGTPSNISLSFLEEGKVEVSTNKSSAKKEDVVLSPKQQLVYNKENETNTIEEFDLQKVIGWKDNILVFDNEPLSKVLVPLERYFGVKFEIADQSLANRTIKANFKNESFWTVVNVLEKATGLTYKTSKENNEFKKVVFYKK